MDPLSSLVLGFAGGYFWYIALPVLAVLYLLVGIGGIHKKFYNAKIQRQNDRRMYPNGKPPKDLSKSWRYY
jgi:hypothetical protein